MKFELVLFLLVSVQVSLSYILNIDYRSQPKCYGRRSGAAVNYLILHHTAGYFESDLNELTKCPGAAVSAHYLVPKTPDRNSNWQVYRLVEESDRAYHAGGSTWQGENSINSKSIGIEITHRNENDDYPDGQISTVIALIKDILSRYYIDPTRIVGHADVNYYNKSEDPGRMFPWQKLYENGIGMWPSADDFNANEQRNANLKCAQMKLEVIGYKIDADGIMGQQTHRVLWVFQKHFGLKETQMADGPTASTIEALINRYFPAKLSVCEMFP